MAQVRQRRLGDVLVESGTIGREAVEEAVDRQRRQDSLLGHILLVEGQISSEALVDALAEQSGLGRVDLTALPPDPECLAGVDPYRCLTLGAIPWRRAGHSLLVAIANPDREPAILAAFAGAGPVSAVLAELGAIRDAIGAHFGGRLAADALTRCPPELSCRTLFGRGGWRWGAAALLAVTGAVWLAPWVALSLALGWIVLMNAATMALRFTALLARLRAGPQADVGAPRLVDSLRLPTVSLLVPLWREERVAAQLLEALSAMRYPAPLLDIKLVLEEEDATTRAAILNHRLPPTIEVVTVPSGAVRTKPRAMNFALPFCRGEIVGIYDAEDKPDPGQLRDIVQHLVDAPPDVACVQGCLDFYNGDRNWLARCFTIEYAIWFRLLLPGLQRLGLPIPLGGTTVFFRRGPLEAIGAWDAHNVTEDADLGMRLARAGYRCELMATTTLEEANCEGMRSWIGQRSRWLKGYAITWASHMRRPLTLRRDLGWRGFIAFQVLLLGGLTSYLAIPLLWLLWTAQLGLDLGLDLWKPFPQPVRTGFLVLMVFGQAVMVATAVVALRDAGRARTLPWLLVWLFYAPLGAVAACRAVFGAFTAPFHWQKTEHGLHLSEEQALSRREPAQARSRGRRSR